VLSALLLTATAGCSKKDTPPPTPAVAPVSLSALDVAKLEANAKAAGYVQSGNDPEQLEAGTLYSLKYQVEGKDVFVSFYDFSGWEKSASKPSIVVDGDRILYVSTMADSGAQSSELAGKVRAAGVSKVTKPALEGIIKGAGWKLEESAEDEDGSTGVKTIEIEGVRGDDAKGDEADATVNLYDFAKPVSEGRALVKDNRGIAVGCAEDAALAQKVLQKLTSG